MPKPELSTCLFSDDGRYRYLLDYAVDDTVPAYARKTVVWVMLNPSVANQTQLDRTLRRTRGFTQRLGAHHMAILNVFAFVGQDPKTMLAADDPIGTLNDETILKTVAREGVTHVIAGWGTMGSHRGRAAQVMEMLAGRLSALRINADSSPAHPLYLPYTCAPQPFGLPAPIPLDTTPQLG